MAATILEWKQVQVLMVRRRTENGDKVKGRTARARRLERERFFF